MTRETVEGTEYISINVVKGLLGGNEVYTISWSNGSEVAAAIGKDRIILAYYRDNEEITSQINIDYTIVGYGKRPWFKCPACDRRTARLYNMGMFACRNCHRLTYTTSQRSGNSLKYLGWKIRRLQIKLGIDVTKVFIDVRETPLFKPKGMHQKTFDSLLLELKIMQLHFDEEWLKLVRF